MLKLTWRNTIRHPLRASLTVLGMALAVLAFCLLRTVVAAWYAGVSAASPSRLVTRSAISLMFRLPMAYLPKIQGVQGVKTVTYGNWFGGVYIDERHFFPQFSVSIPNYFEIYPEYQLPPDQKIGFFQDRRGAAAGRQLAARYGWKVGDAIILQGRIFPGEFRFILRAIYTGRDSSIDEGRFYFNWEYLNEALKKTMPDRADQVSWFIVEVTRPELAATVAAQIDAMFKNSLAETLTETEAAFLQGFVSMTEAILLAIQVVSWVVIGVILVVLANTMAMSARERLGEYAVLKTMGFRPRHLAGLILGESLLLALMGGLLGLGLTFPAVHVFKTQMGQYFRVFPLTRLTLALGLGTALAVGILAAAMPAWRASRVGIAAALRKVG
ncbi:MAG: ABC transporter permease [Deltaproteobacteria bacterium]|nr:ABC transporter permease [Deltaproteobacteria bacterium]MBI4797123.1 ABC transporter permease [Deltaproteobacteria bacterium]